MMASIASIYIWMLERSDYHDEHELSTAENPYIISHITVQ